MADCTYIQVLRLTVIAELLLLCVAQNTHMQNVAMGKACGISSTWNPSDTCSAVINGNIRDLNYPGNCIHTASYDNSPFWWVDLGTEFTISTMTIYGRTGYIDRMTQVNILLDNNIVKSFTRYDTWTNDKYDITVGRVGRIVKITKDSNSGETMNICQVEVWAQVCYAGWYGHYCTQACTYCPSGSVCDEVDGNCTTCETGFKLPHCEACDNGWYGDNCTQSCGHCAGRAVCDKVTGNCTSCQTGFLFPLCKVCRDGL
ncbi:uncharacterized protein LOC112572698 [Pomacea canaliculata]|uniref:uncharacterized protein LOC112572698 n=1 Tax=Pomacea canaliculata TaxID=400727 RepID=UPI000D737E47|nr:uncharacterized protein LOC112572698 [Pomacea canaliculata]XP_025108296.1 uncharacterized protein LOC112572698 [Pomacea canaliculata]XP_025108297.1 uncharacterized protein LOC112572698 [Pomacea canaliculata]